MANFCEYEIHVKGSKKAALMVYAATPSYEEKEITYQEMIGDDYVVHFTGDCKWSLDAYCEPAKQGIDLELIDEDDFDEDCGEEYWYISLKEKSELLHCEIQAHSWSEESGFDGFEHYKDGKEIKKEYIDFNEIDSDDIESLGEVEFEFDF